MATALDDVGTDRRPLLSVPLRHFAVAPGFLLVGVVRLTTAGAVTQFVPVWAGTALHSRRSRVQLGPLAGGLAGFVASLLTRRPGLLAPFGALALAGFRTLVYTVGRMLDRPLDVTERHFALAACFVALTTLGLALGCAVPPRT